MREPELEVSAGSVFVDLVSSDDLPTFRVLGLVAVASIVVVVVVVVLGLLSPA